MHRIKQKRKIINRSNQQTEDNFVGNMTIKVIDDELAIAENAEQDLSFPLLYIERL